MSFQIPFTFFDVPGIVRVEVYDTEIALRRSVRRLADITDDTIAYAHCYSVAEDKDVVGVVYFVQHPSVETISHEAVHLASGVLSRLGHKTFKVTTDKSPEAEEKMAQIVGALTAGIAEDLEYYGEVRAKTKLSVRKPKALEGNES